MDSSVTGSQDKVRWQVLISMVIQRRDRLNLEYLPASEELRSMYIISLFFVGLFVACLLAVKVHHSSVVIHMIKTNEMHYYS